MVLLIFSSTPPSNLFPKTTLDLLTTSSFLFYINSQSSSSSKSSPKSF